MWYAGALAGLAYAFLKSGSGRSSEQRNKGRYVLQAEISAL